jgi:DNA-binding transcriptional regulator YiaG
MSNIASVLKSEIVRLARREIRGEVASLRKASTQHRATIAALRREVQQLRQQLRSSAKSARTSAPAAQEGELKLRFRPAGLAAHRKKLGLSAQDYGLLVGVSGQTIYHWEEGQRPRAAQLQALAGVRGIGKREAAKRLADLAEKTERPAKRAKPARKGARRRAK